MFDVVLPISLLILSAITILCIVRESMEKEKLQKIRFVLIGLVTFSLILVMWFRDSIEASNQNALKIIYPIYVVVIGLLMFNSIYLSIKEKKIRDQYFKCVEEQSYFAYLTTKNRIRSISKSFAIFLNAKPEKLKNLRFSEALAQRYTNLLINDNEYNESNIESIFSNIKNSEHDLKIEIKCLDVKGRDVTLSLIDRPIRQNNHFIGHILFGKSSQMEEINRTEEELSSKSEKLEMNRLRFMALLENGHDNVFFYNIASNSLWANDALVKSLGFSGNSISYEEYKKRIAPDDLSYYENVINDLSIKNPNYDIKYRFRDKYDYVYIHEVGKKIYGPETEIISVIEKETNRFERTGNSTLDNIGDLTGLYDTLNRLSNQAIELVVVVLENIKDINEQFDRATGSLAMNDYIAAFNKEFCNDNLMFRTDGREFAFVLTDFKKMEILKRALEAGKVTRANCTYGENRILVKSTIGIVSNTTCKDPKQLLRFARNAVRLAENPDYQKDYSYYE